MGLKNVLKVTFISALNPVRWLGMSSLKQQSSAAGKLIKSTFKGGAVDGDGFKPTSFDDCMRHYKVDEQGLKRMKRNSLYTTYFCLTLSLFTLGYMFYLFAHGTSIGGIMCIVLTILLWAMATRESFNLYQMNQRRLGCTFKEWFKSLFK